MLRNVSRHRIIRILISRLLLEICRVLRVEGMRRRCRRRRDRRRRVSGPCIRSYIVHRSVCTCSAWSRALYWGRPDSNSWTIHWRRRRVMWLSLALLTRIWPVIWPTHGDLTKQVQRRGTNVRLSTQVSRYMQPSSRKKAIYILSFSSLPRRILSVHRDPWDSQPSHMP